MRNAANDPGCRDFYTLVDSLSYVGFFECVDASTASAVRLSTSSYLVFVDQALAMAL